MSHLYGQPSGSTNVRFLYIIKRLKLESRAAHEPSEYPMRRKEVVGLHFLPIEAKRRRSKDMPLYPADCVELVAHVRGIIIWLDLVHRRRADFEAWMDRFVEHLTAFVSEGGVAHELGGEYEPHRVSRLPTWPDAEPDVGRLTASLYIRCLWRRGDSARDRYHVQRVRTARGIIECRRVL